MKRNDTLWLAVFAGFLSFIFSFFGPLSASGDLFYHLAFGRYVWTNHALPPSDFVNFGHWAGVPEYHSWLGSVILFLVQQWGGELGLRILFGAIVYAGLLSIIFRFPKNLWVWPLAAISFLVFRQYGDLKPSILGAVLFVYGTLWILPRFSSSLRDKGFVFMWSFLWVNIHGSGLLAPLLSILFVKKGYRIKCAALTLVATLMNPMGWSAYFQACALAQTAVRHQVLEWGSPQIIQLGSGALQLALTPSSLFVVVLFVVFGLLLRRKEWGGAFSVGLTTTAFLSSQRNFVWLIIGGCIAIQYFNREIVAVRRRGHWAVATILVTLLLQPWRWEKTVALPVRAKSVLTEWIQPGAPVHLYTYPAWAAYFYWDLPEVRVAVDCRVLTFNRFYEALKSAPQGESPWLFLAENLKESDLIIFPTDSVEGQEAGKRFLLLWRNETASIFTKRSSRVWISRAKDYYSKQDISFDENFGFRVAKAAAENPKWWNLQREEGFPSWDRRGELEERKHLGKFLISEGMHQSARQVFSDSGKLLGGN